MSEDGNRVSVEVRIAGEDHVIRSNAAPEYTRKCARIVDERIQGIRDQSGLIETHKAAILAALSITDELLQVRQDLEELRTRVETRTEELAQRLESVVSE